MGKLLKIIGIIVAVLILLFAIAIFLLTQLIDPNNFKQEITESFYAETQRSLHIEGDIGWSFFPWLGLTIHNVSVNNQASFKPKLFAKLQTAEVKVKLIPLFSGHVEIGNVTLDKVNINLIKNKSGKVNWEFTSDKSKQKNKSEHKPENEKSDGAINNFTVNNIDIKHGSIHYFDQSSGKKISLQDINLSSKNIHLGQPFTIQFNAKVSEGKKINLPIKIDSTINLNKSFEQVDIKPLVIQSNNLNIQGNITASHLKNDMRINGELDIPSFNLKTFLGKTLQSDYQPTEKNALTKVGAKINFSANTNAFNLSSLMLNLDQTLATGHINVNNFSKPAIQFAINANQINLDHYLPAKQPSSKKSTAQQNKSKSTDNFDLPIALLRDLNISGTLSLKQLTAFGLKTTENSATMTAKNGVLKINSLKAKLYQGHANASFMMNVKGKIPSFSFNTQLSKVQIQALLIDLKNIKMISGSTNLNFKLNTRGLNTPNLLQNLGGNTQFNLNDGVIQGINIDYQIQRARALIARRAVPAQPAKNETPFTEISGSAIIKNGIANNQDLKITTPIFNANGMGDINLINNSLQYRLNIKTTQAGDLDQYTLPFIINGQLNSPKTSLDTAGLLKQVANIEIKKRVPQLADQAKETINKNLGDKLGKALGGLFG